MRSRPDSTHFKQELKRNVVEKAERDVVMSVARKIVKAAQNKREEHKQYGNQWEDLATLLFV